MLTIQTYTAPDSFGGIGLFSSKFIESGTLLWVFHPEIDIFFSLSDYAALKPNIRSTIEKYVYPGIRQGIQGVLYSRDNDRFTNHSFRPNSSYIHNTRIQPTDPLSWRMHDSSKTRVFAKRDIKVGEEITANYYDFLPQDLPDFYSNLASFAFLKSLAA